jgi:hypothetical protein
MTRTSVPLGHPLAVPDKMALPLTGWCPFIEIGEVELAPTALPIASEPVARPGQEGALEQDRSLGARFGGGGEEYLTGALLSVAAWIGRLGTTVREVFWWSGWTTQDSGRWPKHRWMTRWWRLG